ncbi:MAG: TraR/DksA C4-type zinc finger protein [Nitrospirae bacterium]|nr:TraR/DksA C4-type zinc finger protein [Nitrospirota bacterium]
MMPAKKQDALRKMLIEKKREIWNDVKDKLFQQLGKDYRSEIDTVLDEGDKALSDLAEETGLTLVDLRKGTLEKIDHALKKLDEGTYGICEDCGNEISEQRLKALPFAVHCVECKQRREELEEIEKERERFGATPSSEPGEEAI